MKGREKERWLELCELAVNERDPEQFMLLVKQINDLLEAKERGLRASRPEKPATHPPTEE